MSVTQKTQYKKLDKEAREKCSIVTPMFRVSYPHVFKPQQVKPTDKPKYAITGLFPKNADLTILKEAIRQAKINEFGPNKKDWPEIESPVTDGDDSKFADKEGYAGHYIIKFTRSAERGAPKVVNAKRQPITDAQDFYPGCYAYAQVYAYVWEYMGRHGVGFIVDSVLKAKEGEPFGGAKSIDEAYKDVVIPENGDDESGNTDDEDEGF